MLDIDAAISAATVAFSSGLTAALARSYIVKSLGDLDKIANFIHEIKEELAAISVKLESQDRDHEMILEHDRKIATLAAKMRKS